MITAGANIVLYNKGGDTMLCKERLLKYIRHIIFMEFNTVLIRNWAISYP